MLTVNLGRSLWLGACAITGLVFDVSVCHRLCSCECLLWNHSWNRDPHRDHWSPTPGPAWDSASCGLEKNLCLWVRFTKVPNVLSLFWPHRDIFRCFYQLTVVTLYESRHPSCAWKTATKKEKVMMMVGWNTGSSCFSTERRSHRPKLGG